METFRFKILQLAIDEGLLDDETFKHDILIYTKAIANLLRKAGRTHDAILFDRFRSMRRNRHRREKVSYVLTLTIQSFPVNLGFGVLTSTRHVQLKLC